MMDPQQLVGARRRFAWLDDVPRDVRYAGRLLRREPVFALMAALSVAIGIGGNTTIFTVANALLFRHPAGVLEPNRLVDIGRSRGGGGFSPNSYPNFLDIRQRTTTLQPRSAKRRGRDGSVWCGHT